MDKKNLVRQQPGDEGIAMDAAGQMVAEQPALYRHGGASRVVGEAKWISVSKAAVMLGFGVVSLRRLIERHARRGSDGGIEVHVDGIRARKVGRTWRVFLSEAWTSPSGSPRGSGLSR